MLAAVRDALKGFEAPLRRRLVRGAFWSTGSAGINRFVAMLSAMVVARLLGREQFGELGVVQSTVSVFGIVAGLGTSLTATKYVAEYRQKDPERTARIIRLARWVALASACLLIVMVQLAAPWLASRTLALAQLTPYIRIGAGLLFFEAVNSATIGALAGFEAFSSIAKVDLVCGLLGVGCAVTGVLLGGLPGALVGMIVGLALHFVGYSFMLQRITRAHGIERSSGRDCLREWRMLIRFSLPALLAAAVATQVGWLCRVVVVNQPNGYSEMGLFNAANQWRTAILLLPATLSHSILPVLSNLSGQEDRQNYRRVLLGALGANALLALIAGGGVIACSRLILLGYGSQFAGARGVLIVLACAAMLAAMVGVIGQAIASEGRMWSGFVLNAIWAAVLLGSLWGLRHLGAMGFAWANVIAYSVHLFTVGAFAFFVIRAHLVVPPRPVEVKVA